MSKLDKFNEVYSKIIMEMNEANKKDSRKKKHVIKEDLDKTYDLTILYTVDTDNESYPELYNDKYEFDEDKAKAAGDAFFAKFGGKRTTDEDYDVAYYLGELSNAGIYAWPYEFKGLTKDQLVELMNSETPFNEGMSLLELVEQYVPSEDCELENNDIYNNSDALVEYLKQAMGASIIHSFKEI